jgi:hypothetical protein
LPRGPSITLISSPAFLATQFEAFRTCGKADLLQSHDFEDIINVVEGRFSIMEEAGPGGTAATLAAKVVVKKAGGALTTGLERLPFFPPPALSPWSAGSWLVAPSG